MAVVYAPSTAHQRHARLPAPHASEQHVRIHLLGGFRVAVGATVIPDQQWRRKKARTIVKLLALAPQQRLHREQVIDAIWPDLDLDAAQNNLHVTLHAARRILQTIAPTTSYLRLERDQVVLSLDGPIWTDVAAYEAAAATVLASDDPHAYYEALQLYCGELLPEDRYEDWVEHRREALRQQHLALLLDLARLHAEQGDIAPALDAYQRVLAIEPAHEAAHAGIMRLYASQGRRQQALRQYRALCDALQHELDVEPEPATQQLHREIAAGRFPILQRAPRPTRPPARRHNLPAALTSFVGRQCELAEICRLLATNRLLTLTGIGGKGKTRLALEAGRALLDAYADDVWLVELAAVNDATLVVQTVAKALGLHEEHARPLIETLTDTLHSRRMLLLLDNCEHLLDACAALATTLLKACPHLRILATSREQLHVPGEVVWRIPSLSLPDLQTADTLEALDTADAVDLFVERARCYQPGFRLTPQNRPVVIDICRRLDGLPLAIELAAARVRVLSVEQLAARLDTTPHLLEDSNRLIELRHQTLRATLEWSAALLCDAERMLLHRLSVFAGGWTLEAAETICADDAISTMQVLDVLTQLIDKSLVLTDMSRDGLVRYRLLESVRAYGCEQLEAGDDARHVRLRHARFYVALAEMAEPALRGADQAAWLDRLEIDHDNLRAALQWSIENGEAALSLRLSSALLVFWHTRGYLSEGQHWLNRALAAGHTAAPQLRAKALWSIGRLSMFQGDYPQATAALEASRELYQQAGDPIGDAYACSSLGSLAIFQGAYDQAVALLEASAAVFRAAADQYGCAVALVNLAAAFGRSGRHQQAAIVLEESLACFQAVGEKRGIMATLSNLGATARYQREYGRAQAFIEEALELARELGDQVNAAWLINTSGQIALDQGAYEQAATRFRECLPLLQAAGDKEATIQCLEGLVGVIGATGDAKRAVRLFGALTQARAAFDVGLSAEDRVWYERHLSPLRGRLCSDDFDVAWQRGQMMSLEEAVTYALASLPPTVTGCPRWRGDG